MPLINGGVGQILNFGARAVNGGGKTIGARTGGGGKIFVVRTGNSH